MNLNSINSLSNSNNNYGQSCVSTLDNLINYSTPSNEDTNGNITDISSSTNQIATRPDSLLLLNTVSNTITENIESPPSPATAISIISEHLQLQPKTCSTATSPLSPSFETASTYTNDMASNEYIFDRESTWKEIDSIVASLGSLQCSLDPADNSLLSWLSSIDLSHHYEQILITNGFDHLDFMCPEFVDDDTLLEIGILNSNHRKKILRAVANRPNFQIIKNPESVHDWLDLLSLAEYLPLFEMNGFSSLRPEVEMSSVLQVPCIGHRKRMIVSLSKIFNDRERTGESNQQKRLHGQENNRENYLAESINSIKNVTLFNGTTQLENGRDKTKEWERRHNSFLSGGCNYLIQYHGSKEIGEFTGNCSIKDIISAIKKTFGTNSGQSVDFLISHRQISFQDATNKRPIASHDIRNVYSAGQDETLRFLAYVSENVGRRHECHLFSTVDAALSTEIILTLGQAFEIAYRLAVRDNEEVEDEFEIGGEDADDDEEMTCLSE